MCMYVIEEERSMSYLMKCRKWKKANESNGNEASINTSNESFSVIAFNVY